MKKLYTIVHLVLVLFTLLFCTVKGQNRIEMIPYRLIPNYDATCHRGIEVEIIKPVTFNGLSTIYSYEIEEIIVDRVIFETTNQFAQNEVFEIDGKHYYLLRVPYTGANWNNGI